MKTSQNSACQGCQYNGGILCLSKIKKKNLQYQKFTEGKDVLFHLIHCEERKIVETATS